jgi:hypothetical protein
MSSLSRDRVSGAPKSGINVGMGLGLALMVLFFLISGAVAYRNVNVLREDTARIQHSHAVIGALDELLSALKDAETGQRGFLLTGSDRYLAPYNQAFAHIGPQLDGAASLVSDIASIEIPPLEETLIDWLRAQPDKRLIALGVDPDDIGERTFYPRLALGDYLQDQFQALLKRAERQGVDVTIRTRCRVLDAVSTPDGMVLKFRPRHGAVFEQSFDHVVRATGHQWPAEPEVRPGYFLSPWPASALAAISPCKIGIRGTSLSAIDASVALAVSHGDFVEDGEGTLRYEPAPDTEAFSMTIVAQRVVAGGRFFPPGPV